MGRDGDWIHAGAAYPAGDGDDWSDDDEWPDDDVPPVVGGAAGIGPGDGRGWGHGGVSGFSVLAVVVVAVVAAIAGAAVGFLLVRGTPVASASAPASVLPSSGRGTGPQARPGRPGGASGDGSGQLRILLTGRVLAVSGTSITIGGAGPSVTAAVTSATKITGRAHAVAGVKVGDQVAAQLTGTPSHLTLTTLQDPAQ